MGLQSWVRLRLRLWLWLWLWLWGWGGADMQLCTESVQDANRENNCRRARMRLSRPGRKTVLCCFLMAFPRPLRRPRWDSPNTKIHALPASRGVLPHQSAPTAGFGTLLQRPRSRALAAYWEHGSIKAQSRRGNGCTRRRICIGEKKTPSDCNMSPHPLTAARSVYMETLMTFACEARLPTYTLAAAILYQVLFHSTLHSRDYARPKLCRPSIFIPPAFHPSTASASRFSAHRASLARQQATSVLGQGHSTQCCTSHSPASPQTAS